MRTLHAKVGGSLHREVSRCGSRYARSLQCARIPAQPALRDFPKFASFNFCIDTGSAILRSMEDTPNIAKRRLREERTISQMISLYCAGNHSDRDRSETAYCGESLCEECKAIDDYAVLRTQRCRKMEVKTSCDECEHHCYKPEERKGIRTVMRYSGPRMMKAHPIAALRHLLGR